MQSPVQEQGIPLNQATEVARAEFIRKTYIHLAGAILGFVVVEALLLNSPWVENIARAMTQGMAWLLVLGGFMLVTNMANKWALTSTDRNKQYAALALYVVAEAIIFVPLLYVATEYFPGVIPQAGVITLFLFSGLTAVVFATNKDFSFLRKAITIGGFVALGLIVAGIIFGFNLGIFFSFAMVGLAAASILYQTSQMVHHYNTDQYVAASLGLFASFMLLLWYVLDILMRLQGD